MGFGIRLYHGPERFTGTEISKVVARWLASQIPEAKAGQIVDELLGPVPILHLPGLGIGILGRRVPERQRSCQEAVVLLERHPDLDACLVFCYPDIWFACRNVHSLEARMNRDRLDALLFCRQDEALESTDLPRLYLREAARWLAGATGPPKSRLPRWKGSPPQKGGGSGGAS